VSELRYERPGTLAEARALLGAAPGRAAVLAGGTDLLVGLRAGARAPDLLVDVKRVAELAEVRWSADGELTLGAAVTLRRLHEDERIQRELPALAEGAAAVGSFQIRCRATLGGNLCNASPCMDTAPPLLVMGAQLLIVGPAGDRQVALADFFRGPKATALAPGELLVSVVVPARAARLHSGFAKIKRLRGHDLALVNAAAAHDPDAGTLQAAVGSCGPTPILTPPIAAEGEGSAQDLGERLAAMARRLLRPIDDVRASAEYRADMADLLCRRLAGRLLGEAASRGRT
jgi:carbon-monoxide dehydrogenase medium subunit